MKIIFYFVTLLMGVSILGCSSSENSTTSDYKQELTDSITRITASYPGEIGVALIIDNQDTITVNDESKYPMMSVFKLHQAIALCDSFDRKGVSPDTVIAVNRKSLDPGTWSPMLKDHLEDKISISVKELLQYTLMQSDNNASNLMFKQLNSLEKTDSMIATLIPRHSFRIAYSEDEMSDNHKRAYSNYTSPLGAAMLINRLFTDSIISNENQEFIKRTLTECKTGQDRIVSPLIGKEGVTVAHKTGSGYRDNEILVAHNDVAYITLPNGIKYSLAVFVKDFGGNETDASQAIAEISEFIYKSFIQLT